MAELNRNQFKASTLNSIKDEQGRAEAAIPVTNYPDSRPGFHTIVDGKNWRRIAPSHKLGEPAYRAKSTVSLECEVPEVDGEGKETGKKEIKRKQIFIATQHSTTLKEDPITMYIAAVLKLATDTIDDKDERAKFLYPINGWRSKDGKWNWGIKPSIDYVCYCWDEKGVLGREQLYPSMIDDMKRESVKHSPDDAEIVPDIFTDPDQGFPLIIDRYKDDKKKTHNDISADLPKRGEEWSAFFERTRITDEQLIDFMSKESLTELYKDVYTLRDFNMAVDGLQRFDKANKYGIFDDQDFLDALANLKSQVPEYKTKDQANDPVEAIKNIPAKTAAPSMKAPAAQTKSEPAAVTPIAMKRALREYITVNYGGAFELPALTSEDLVKWYELTLIDEELPFADYEAAAEVQAPIIEKEVVSEKVDVKEEAPAVEKPKATPPPAKTTPPVVNNTDVDPELAAQIEALRARRGNRG